MKIRVKIMLFTSLFLALVVGLITALSAYNIKLQGKERLQTLQEEKLDQVKDHLKDLVDVAYETIDKYHQNLSDLDYLGKFYERRLHDIINTGDTIISRYKRMVDTGRISEETAKQRALAEIRELRFDGGTGYIWINDVGEPYPRMVMHPTVPDLDGKILNSRKYNNAQGIRKNLFQAFVEITRDAKEGYVDYLWPKPTEDGGVTDEEVPKLSYVRRYDDWGWILGTGIYIDDARIEIENQIKQAIKSMRYAEGTGYFWINDNTLPYPYMIMHPTVPELDGTILDDPKYNNALGVDQNLFQAFAEVTAASSDGSGFVDYLWPKPTPQGLTERLPKMSFVRLHEPTGWIIGSGAYIDNIDEEVKAGEFKINQQVYQLIQYNLMASVIFLIIVIAVTYVFSSTFSKPIEHLTEIAEQISKGKNLDLPIEEVQRKDEIGELAKSIDRLKNSVKIMITKLTKK